eukprot:g5117.t1
MTDNDGTLGVGQSLKKPSGGAPPSTRRYALPTREEANLLRQNAPFLTVAGSAAQDGKGQGTKRAGARGKVAGAIQSARLQSNLIRLEVDALLESRRLIYDPNEAPEIEALNDGLMSMKSLLTTLKPRKGIGADSDKYTRKLTLFDAHKRPVVLDFVAPARIDIIGSYLLRTLVKQKGRGKISVDIAVQMPPECFLRKDILDHRYDDKRALYAAVLLKALASSPLFKDPHFEGFRARDSSKVVACAFLKRQSRFKVRLFPCLAAVGAPFDLSRLAPDMGNLRAHRVSAKVLRASPRYNCTILEDVCLRSHLQLMHGVATRCRGFIDAAILLKAWARQRGMLDAPDTFNGFLLSALLVHVIECQSVPDSATPWQLYGATLEWISKHDLCKSGIILTRRSGAASVDEEAAEMLRAAQRLHDVIMLDPDQPMLNIASRVSTNAFRELQHEAQQSYHYIKSGKGSATLDIFEPLFLRNGGSFWSKYDHYTVIAPAEAKQKGAGLRWDISVMQDIADILGRALRDRAKLIRVVWHAPETPGALSQVPDRCPIAVGVLLDPQVAEQTLDKGPPADSEEEAMEFRSFWGKLSQLRRFRDGSILEAVLWDCEPRLVVRSIVEHVIRRHIPSSGKMKHSSLLPLKTLLPTSMETSCKSLVRAVDQLGADLMNCNGDLPSGVHIRQVRCADAAYSYTSAVEPSKAIHPCHIVIELEQSGRWPDNIAAVRSVKLALLCHLVKMLRCDGSAQAVGQSGQIDIEYADYVFRLEVHCAKEDHLMNMAVSKKPLIIAGKRKRVTIPSEGGRYDEEGVDGQYAAAILAKHLRNVVIRPAHVASMRALHMRNTAYGPTVRLAKRWIASMMLSTAFEPEAIELLVAATFCEPTCRPFSPPSTPLAGFARFLKLLATFSWDKDPLIVDTAGDLSVGDRVEAEKGFYSALEVNSGMEKSALPMHIVHSNCRKGSEGWTPTWTSSDRPSLMSLKRTVSLAKAAYKSLEPFLSSSWKLVFQPPNPSVYDAVIRVDVRRLPGDERTYMEKEAALVDAARGKRLRKNIENATDADSGSTYKNIRLAEGLPSLAPLRIRMSGFDPLKIYVSALQKEFGHLAEFFADLYGGGGGIIGIVWRERKISSRPFTVSSSRGMKMSEEGNKFVVVDRAAVLQEMCSMGGRLVLGVSSSPSST